MLHRLAGTVCHHLGRGSESDFNDCLYVSLRNACCYGGVDFYNWCQDINRADKDLPICEGSRGSTVFPGDGVVTELQNSEVELTAYCGLYCGDCLRYKSKAADLARALQNELQKVKFDKYAKVKGIFVEDFKHYTECRKVLNAIIKLKCDTPCRVGGDGCLQPCEIKNCVQTKKLEGCWECDEFEGCNKFELFKLFHGDTAKENLRKIKKYSLDGWVEKRGKFYPWL
jgi:hypothetical protein